MAIKKSSGSGIPSGLNAGRPANPGFGQLYSNGETNRLELYTQSSGWQNIVQETPGVASITGNYLESTNSGTIIISGTNFVSGCYATAIGTNGVQIDAASTTFNSLVQVTATFTGLSNAQEPYDIKVTNPSNLFGMLPDALYVNANPVWVTAAGSLGTFQDNVLISVSATASDDSVITYSLASGSTLPSGVTLSSSTGLISGTPPDVSSNTTYTFTINATDGSNPTISRTFSFTSNAAPVWVTSAGSLGSFANNTNITTSALSVTDSDAITYSLASGSSLPAGLTLNSTTGVISGSLPVVSVETVYNFTINANDGINSIPRSFSITSKLAIPSVEYLLVGGGGGAAGPHGAGGGAGGMLTGTTNLFIGTAYNVSVGNGGSGNSQGNQGGDGVSTIGFNLTAGGGGGGGRGYSSTGVLAAGRDGLAVNGNGGGAGSTGTAGVGNGNGKNGGNGNPSSPGSGGGGGGAGAVGNPGTGSGSGGAVGGAGGIGAQSSITGAALYYAGGGGGGGWTTGGASGGQGGGGSAGGPSTNGNAGTPNTGGGGGAGGDGSAVGAAGGSGVVIIAYPNTSPAISNIPGTLTYDQPTRSGYRVYRFTAGTGNVTI